MPFLITHNVVDWISQDIFLLEPSIFHYLFQSLLFATRMDEVAVELTSTKTQLTIGFVKAVENAKEVYINHFAYPIKV